MAKLEKETPFIVMPYSYDFAFRFNADWETEKSFGIRGSTFDCVRYSRSTGDMYSKDRCSWKKFNSDKEANEFMDKLDVHTSRIEELKAQIKTELDAMRSLLNAP